MPFVSLSATDVPNQQKLQGLLTLVRLTSKKSNRVSIIYC